jgi:hypothetical protein
LTFNPDGIVKGGKNAGNGQISGVSDATFPDIGLDHPTYPATSYGIEVPMLHLTPIAHRSSEAVRKDTYIIHLDLALDKYDMRVELYSLDGDPELGIYGVDIESLQTAGTLDAVPLIYDPFFVEVKADGEIVMQTYQKKPIFQNFKRLSAVGGTGTVLYCTVLFNTSKDQMCLQTDGEACFNDVNYSHQYSLTYEFKSSVLRP